jgi:hypothetical protein
MLRPMPKALPAWLLGSALLCGCALPGGSSAGRCKIEVVRVDSWGTATGKADVGFHVRGEAGESARTWLVAERADGTYIPGDALEVGPGPFEAVIELDLTGRPRRYLALLELGSGKRCKDGADVPS